MYERNPDFEADLVLAKDPDTSEAELNRLLRKHFGEVEIAEAIARNPSCPYRLFVSFWRFMHEVAEQNPAKETHQKHPHWHTSANRKPRPKYHQYADDISQSSPSAYRARYLMQHGDGGWKRFIMGAEPIPEQLIRDYVSDKSAPVRKVIASRITAPADIFEQLSRDSAKTVRLALASNPHAPVEILARLTTDKVEAVAEAARNNPNCPDEAVHQARLNDAAHSKPVDLEKLSFSKLFRLAAGTELAEEQIATLGHHKEPCVRFLIGTNPLTPAALLEQLAQDPEEWVQASAAFNPNTPAETLTRLVDSANHDILLGLASNPSLPESAQLQLAEKANERIGLTLANLTNFSSVWEKLTEGLQFVKKATYKSWRHFLADALKARSTGKFASLQRAKKSRHLFVSRIAAISDSCPDDLASYYAHYIFSDYSKNPKVALAMLEGKTPVKPQQYREWKLDQWMSTGEPPGHVSNYYAQCGNDKRKAQAASAWTTELLYLLPLVVDDNVNTRKRLARRKDLIQFVYEILARDEKSGVREEIAKNRSTPKNVLERLSSDNASNVHTSISQCSRNADVPERKSGIANQGSATERARVAKRSTTPEMLTELAGDRAASVRATVAANRKTPPEVVAQLALHDKEAKVRVAAVGQCRDEAVIKQALNDSDKTVRITAASNSVWRKYQDRRTHYNQDFLSWISDSGDEEVRAIAAKYCESVSLQRQLMHDSSVLVQRALATNQFLSTDDKLTMVRITDDQETASILARKTTNEELFLIAASMITSSHVDDPIRCHAQMLARPAVQDQLCTHPVPNIRFALTNQQHLTERAISALSNDVSEGIRKRMADRK